MADLAQQEHPASAISGVMGLGLEYLRVLHQQGWFPKGKKHGTYPLGAVVQGYIKYLKERKPRRDATERSALVATQRAKLQLELTKSLGELLPASMVDETLQVVSTTLIADLEALPSRVANELASISEPAVIRARLLEEVRAIRQAVAAALEARAETLKSMPGVNLDLEPAKDSDTVGVGGGESEVSTGQRGTGEVSGEEDPILHSDPDRMREPEVPQGRRGNGHANGQDRVASKRDRKKAR